MVKGVVSEREVAKKVNSLVDLLESHPDKMRSVYELVVNHINYFRTHVDTSFSMDPDENLELDRAVNGALKQVARKLLQKRITLPETEDDNAAHILVQHIKTTLLRCDPVQTRQI